MGGNIWNGVRCFLLQNLFLTHTPVGDRTAGRLDAQTSTMFGYSADINHVGLRGAHHLYMWLLCPHGGDLPRRVRVVSERALDPVT